jgi:hypothetical protein
MAGASMALVPSIAGANPLLSGYGGPGQGEEVILGATLIGGSGGGGGAHPGAAPTSLAVPKPATVTKLTTPTPHSGLRHSRSRSAGSHRLSDASKSSLRAYTAPTVAGAAPPATGSSGGVLGLSIADLLYILLALGGLAVIAAVTRGLASAPRQDGEALKG